jgi:hypothetical protein
MRCPSSKNLQTNLNLTPQQARLVRALAHAVDDPDVLSSLVESSCPKTQQYVRSMHSDPYNSHMWRVTVALYAMDEVVGTSGVEALGPQGDSMSAPPYECLNAGDPYVATLIYRRKTDTLSIGSWGDVAERHPSW